MGRREKNIRQFHKLTTFNKMLEIYFHRLLYDEIKYSLAKRQLSRDDAPT